MAFARGSNASAACKARCDNTTPAASRRRTGTFGPKKSCSGQNWIRSPRSGAMTYGTRTDHYPPTSKILHWLGAISVLTTAPVAIAMDRVAKGPTQDALYNFHKSLGILILILMILRVINRLAAGGLTAALSHE